MTSNAFVYGVLSVLIVSTAFVHLLTDGTKEHGISFGRPAASVTLWQQRHPRVFRLEIMEDNRLALDGVPVSRERLREHLAPVLSWGRSSPKGASLVVWVHDEAESGVLLESIDVARELGIERVSYAIEVIDL